MATGFRQRYPRGKARLLAVLLVTALLVIGACFYIRVNSSWRAAYESSCDGRLYKVFKAMESHEMMHGTLPRTVDIENPESGHHAYSWRATLVEFHLNPGDSGYDFNAAWNSPVNERLSQQVVSLVSCPCRESACKGNETSFHVIADQGTVFSKYDDVKSSDISDGVANTLLVIETPELCVPVFQPHDVSLRSLSRICKAGCLPTTAPHRRGLLFADGEIFRQDAPIPFEFLKALATYRGGESLTREMLVDQGFISKEE